MNAGAIHTDIMLYVGSWAFGLHFDLYTLGIDVGIGLGPIYPRLFWSASGVGFVRLGWHPWPWSQEKQT